MVTSHVRTHESVVGFAALTITHISNLSPNLCSCAIVFTPKNIYNISML